MKKLYSITLFTTLLIVALETTASAAITTSNATGGNWSATTTWNGGAVPGTTDSIVIVSGAAVTLDASETCGAIDIVGTFTNKAGYTLTVSGGGTSPITYGTVGGTGTITTGTTAGTAGTITLSYGSWTFSGTFTGSRLTVNMTGTANDQTVSGALSCRVFTMAKGNTYTLHCTITPTISTTTTLTSGNVDYNGATQAVMNAAYPAALSISGSGTKTLTLTANRTITGNLTVGDGTTLSVAGAYALTVSGTTTIGSGTSGTLNITATGTKTFVGSVTVNSGATWNNSGNSAITFEGGVTNSGTFTVGTGVQTFSTNAQALSGTWSIPSLTVTGVSLTNNGTLTVSTALAGTGGLTNAAACTLNIGGTCSITTLTATAAGNSVNYTGAAQTVKGTTYDILTLSGSATKTLGAATIIDATGTLTINNGITLAMSTYLLTLNGGFVNNGTASGTTGGVTITGTATTQSIGSFTTTGTVTFSKTAGTATFTGNVNGAKFTLSGNGGTLNLDAGTTGLTHTFTGTFTRTNGILNCSLSTLDLNGTTSGTGGTFNACTGTVTYGGTAAQTIANVNYYNLGFTGARTANITINGAVGVAGTLTTTGLSFTSGTFVLTGSTITFNGSSQTIPSLNAVPYVNLTLSGSGLNTTTGVAVNGILTIGGTATVSAAPTYGGSSSLVYAGSSSQTTGVELPTTMSRSVTINNGNGVALGGSVTMSGTLKLTSGTLTVGANTLTIAGSSPSRTSGTIDASNAYATLAFTNTSPVTLAASLFTGNVNNLTLNGSGGVTLGSATTVAGTLALTSGTLTVGANMLTIAGSSPSCTSGTINASNAGATLAFINSNAITLPGSIFSAAVNNLTINGAGVTAGGNFTVNGVLNLQSANPSTTKGILDMGSYTLSMGVNATTTGTGDVTGIVTRTSFTVNTAYSFGNQFTYMSFSSGAVVPGTVSFTITIGSAPSWKTYAVERTYGIIYTNGSSSASGNVTLRLHYLDSELNGNSESNLMIWDDISAVITEYGKASQDMTNDWVSITGNLSSFGTASSQSFWCLSHKEGGNSTWTGITSTDWTNASNWSPNVVPDSSDAVVIPAGVTNNPCLPASPGDSVNTIDIQSGGILNGGTGTIITVNGGDGAWLNEGGPSAFVAGTSTVIFAPTNENATISGSTNFYNVTIKSRDTLWMQGGSYMGIAGAITNNGIWGAVTEGPSTVEYDGGSQTVVVPDPGTNGYGTLILSGSGTKTMPGTALAIYGNFTVSGTATVVDAGAPLTIDSSVTLGSGTTFNAGDFTHNVAGNWINNGATFTASTGSTVNLNGTGAQSIGGSASTSFYSLTVSNTGAPVAVNTSPNVVGTLDMNGVGTKLTPDAAVVFNSGGPVGTITGNGTVQVTRTAATADYSSQYRFATNTLGNLTVEYTVTGGSQTVSGITYGSLTLDNASGTNTAGGAITATTLNTVAGGTLNMGTNSLSLSNVSNAGTIRTQNTTATPIPTGKTWGGTVQYDAATGNQSVMAGTYGILNLSNTSGTNTAGGAITATILNTTAGGTLNMGTNSLGLTNVSNAGTISTQNATTTPVTSGLSWGGTVEYDGSSGQTAVEGTYNNLAINNAAGVALSGDITVNSTLTMASGNISTGPNTLTLGPTATASEGSGKYVVGNLYKTETVGAGASISLNTIGVALDGGGDSLGTVYVTRVSGSAGAITVDGTTGIDRSWTISSDNPPTAGRNLTLSWVSNDDNEKNLASMQVWRSDDGTTWFPVGGLQNASPSRSVTVSTTSFCEWTVSNGDNSLPVQATDFKAVADIGTVTLSWKTKSEVNNAGFNILRQDLPQAGQTGATSFKLITSYASNDSLKGLGTSTTGRAYDFVDNRVVSGKTYQYKIQSVSTSGSTADLTTISAATLLPKSYALYQNYPNPFNPSTTIRFDLKQASTVTLKLYNAMGQLVEGWDYGTMNAGRYNEIMSLGKYASGVYFYRIMVVGNDGETFVSLKKLVLLK